MYKRQGDGFGDPNAPVRACDQPVDAVVDDTDCDDANGTRSPGAADECDGIDNDCDIEVDENTECTDDDGDGFSELGGDCDDTSTSNRPTTTERCDGVDNDCDNEIDEDTDCIDDDQDGYCEGEDIDGDGIDDCADGSSPGAVSYTHLTLPTTSRV